MEPKLRELTEVIANRFVVLVNSFPIFDISIIGVHTKILSKSDVNVVIHSNRMVTHHSIGMNYDDVDADKCSDPNSTQLTMQFPSY